MKIYLDTSAFVKITNEFIEAIIEIILTHHISADDALQLFSCIVSLSPIFLASDKALVGAAKREGLKAFDAENSEEREGMRRLLVGVRSYLIWCVRKCLFFPLTFNVAPRI
jgi:hypothetical protein